MTTLRKTATRAGHGLIALGLIAMTAPALGQVAQPGGMLPSRGGMPGMMGPAMGMPGMGMPAMGMQAQQAHYQPPYSMAGGYVDAHGNPIVRPAAYGAPMGCGQGGCGDGCYGGACYGEGYGCYGGGCHNGCGDVGPCGRCLGCLMGLCSLCATDGQYGPHYFDFSAEYLNYEREDSAFSSAIFSTVGAANDDLSDVEANAALRTSAVNSEDGDGYRLTGRIDVGALSFAEFVYSGIFIDDAAVATSDGATQLFSIFSRYGTATNGAVGLPGSAGPPTGTDFEETDNADVHRLYYDSELHTAEASFRRYWVGYSPRITGTIMAGFRYTSMEEVFGFSSSAPLGDITIDTGASNHLAGFQFGGDAWFTLIPGLRFGCEAKAGIYNNSYDLYESTLASDGSPNSYTIVEDDQVAFLSEGKVSVVANLTSCLAFKAGYEVLYLSEVALAGDALLGSQPYGDINGIGVPDGLVAPTTDGEVVYHGAHAGLEYTY